METLPQGACTHGSEYCRHHEEATVLWQAFKIKEIRTKMTLLGLKEIQVWGGRETRGSGSHASGQGLVAHLPFAELNIVESPPVGFEGNPFHYWEYVYVFQGSYPNGRIGCMSSIC